MGNLVPFYSYLESIGKTRCTGWRYRKDGLFKTVNIFGKLYITHEEIARFERRALSGEFSKKAVTPTRRAAVA